MTTGAIIFGLAILIGVGLFLGQPYWQTARPQSNPLPSRRQQLLIQKDALLEQIRQMDFDHETSKIDPEVYARARPQLIEQAASLLKQLDELVDPRLDAAIESAITRQRGQVPQSNGHLAPQPALAATSGADAAIEAAIARKRARTTSLETAQPAAAFGEIVERFCSQCGRPRDPEDRFCASCGRKF